MILVNSKTIATMKNIFKSLMLVAVAAMGFACQETMEENYTPTNPREVVMTIIADADEETRTYISDEANGKIAWSEDDQLKVIENSNMYAETSNTEIVDGKAKFTVAFTKASAESFVYNAIFPANIVQEDTPNSSIKTTRIKVITKDTQKPTATSFDPQADILVSKQLEFDAQPTELNMQFKRLVALGKISLANLPADEKISQVVFTAGANDILAGRNYVDAVKGEVTEYGYSDLGTNVLTLNYDEAISTRDIYFTCNPFDMAAGDTFKVKVVCEDNTYTREVTIPENRSLEFTEGDMTTFTVNMKDATIESSFVLADGVYAVIAKSSDKYYAMKGVKGSGDFMTHAEVSYDGEASTFATNDETLGWTITAVEGGYTFQNNEGKYLLYGTGSANTAKLGDAETLTITPIDGTNQYKIAVEAKPERLLGHNARDTRFAFYKGTQVHDLYLVPVVADTTPRFTVSPNAMQTINADGGTIEFKVDAYNGAEVSAQSSDNSWLTIDNSTFIATVQPNQTATERSAKITFSAEGVESVVVTVTQNAKPTEGETQKGWLLVTNASDLAVGDEIIIAAKDSNYALSTTQNDNNRAQTAITKSGDTLVDLSASVQILTLQEGTVAGTFGFYTGSGYLYAPSSSKNYLRTQDNVDANASWKIEIAADGTATIKASGTNSRNVMQYNQSSSLFACYSSASQKALVVYKYYDGGESGGDEPEAPAEPEGGETAKYVKVTSAPSDWSGTYLIVWDNGAHGTVSDKDLVKTVDVTITDDYILSTDTVDAAAVTIAKTTSGYSLKLADGKYLSTNANSNQVAAVSSAFNLTFEYTTSGGVKIMGKDTAGNTRYVLKNGTYYRAYKSVGSYVLPTLYKLNN